MIKNARNTFSGSQYATLDHLINKTRQALTKYKLTVTQLINESEDTICVNTVLALGDSEESIRSNMLIKTKRLKRIDKETEVTVELSPQEKGSAITYARRYSYESIIGIAASEEDLNDDSAEGFLESKRRADTTDHRELKSSRKENRKSKTTFQESEMPTS